jgi:hypothetical protein
MIWDAKHLKADWYWFWRNLWENDPWGKIEILSNTEEDISFRILYTADITYKQENVFNPILEMVDRHLSDSGLKYC